MQVRVWRLEKLGTRTPDVEGRGWGAMVWISGGTRDRDWRDGFQEDPGFRVSDAEISSACDSGGHLNDPRQLHVHHHSSDEHVTVKETAQDLPWKLCRELQEGELVEAIEGAGGVLHVAEPTATGPGTELAHRMPVLHHIGSCLRLLAGVCRPNFQGDGSLHNVYTQVCTSSPRCHLDLFDGSCAGWTGLACLCCLF